MLTQNQLAGIFTNEEKLIILQSFTEGLTNAFKYRDLEVIESNSINDNTEVTTTATNEAGNTISLTYTIKTYGDCILTMDANQSPGEILVRNPTVMGAQVGQTMNRLIENAAAAKGVAPADVVIVTGNDPNILEPAPDSTVEVIFSHAGMNLMSRKSTTRNGDLRWWLVCDFVVPTPVAPLSEGTV
jgi:hypothetical protein